MTNDMPAMYTASRELPAGSVAVTFIILALDEEVNIQRAIRSASFSDQVIVIDSGSTDSTVSRAAAAGAEVVETSWRGFGSQREWALRHPQVRHDWVFFLDADEWISEPLAREIAHVLPNSRNAGYWMHERLIFQGRWIRHSGWYPSARIVRLMDRRNANYPPEVFSEHPRVKGSLGHLREDLVDEDLKGLSRWLVKHVRYAELEAGRRSSGQRAKRLPHESRVRFFLKDRMAPTLPARPFMTFMYMYVLRRGYLDGYQGLLFCLYHAWFQLTVRALQRERNRAKKTMPS